VRENKKKQNSPNCTSKVHMQSLNSQTLRIGSIYIIIKFQLRQNLCEKLYEKLNHL
jgi:hypothetical protein